ncbi:MAG: DNA-binding response regulator [Sulfobacillus benefaciens]|uniref:Stage 0 sporulation protein A homolog n=1 Tax=Sulfobacillus benefaciens TaxID=453960 RepID=A0A2T2XK80_9FIRM|nr:MAG: DNA-binding response regulator [Sulfobacillus benefaciens]
MIRIMIADDQPIVRRGLHTVLEAEKDFQIVGEASNAPEAVQLAASLRPDVVLMDIRMPPADSINAVREIREQGWGKVIMLTTFDTEENVVRALKAGASGFLLKDVEISELANAIRQVMNGQFAIQPELVATYLPALMGASHEDILTAREREILQLVAVGRTNAQIGDVLFVSESTIKNHLTNIFAKLKVHNRTEAIDKARQLHLLE